jgi:hypothetical protein
MIIGGSARPISEIKVQDKTFSFQIPPQWDRGSDSELSFQLNGQKLQGTMKANGKTHAWSGVRAPLLERKGEPQWGEPVALFNGKDLTGWTTQNPKDENQWTAEMGVLRSAKSGANLKTLEKFTDFKLHIEFRYPEGSNSGVYLRGRHEVQISDDKGHQPNSHLFGGIYGLLRPNAMAAKSPGEWQTYDITLVGRMITVVANSETIICNQLIPGITGGALDSNEGDPGPILLQGDHGPVDYRNIILTPAK